MVACIARPTPTAGLAARLSSRGAVRVSRSATRVAVARANLAEKSVSALPAFVKPAAVAAVANVIMALPASADAGKLFDFNLTLPAMAGEFLLLMVFLEKTWFTPVGEVLDKRDAELRGMVGEVKDNSTALAALKVEAEEIIRSARADSAAQVKALKTECQKDVDAKFAAAKAKVDAELAAALASLAKEEAEALKAMEAQVEALSNAIIARVLPEGVTL